MWRLAAVYVLLWCVVLWWVLLGCVLLWCDVVLCYAVLYGRRNLTKNPSLKLSGKNWALGPGLETSFSKHPNPCPVMLPTDTPIHCPVRCVRGAAAGQMRFWNLGYRV